MKVLLVNGSPHANGCTYTALCEVASSLEQNGIETEVFQLGNKPIAGCMGCTACVKTGKCVIDDAVNVFLEKAKTADGFIFGSPVHYASASGAMTSFLDRLFFGSKHHAMFADKPVASVVSARRAGSTAALDQLNKYFVSNNMMLVGSQYWNLVHGNTPEELRQDAEGMQTMRSLGINMSWLLKCIEAGNNAGIERPKREITVRTNFIR